MPRKRDQAPPTGETAFPGGSAAFPGGSAAFPAARGERAAFPAVMGNLPRGGPESWPCAAGETRCPAGEAALYQQLRENVPIIDAAVMRLVRLLGGFRLTAASEDVEVRLNEFLEMIPVGGTQRGISAFVGGYFEQLLTYGTALGELVPREDGQPAALWNAPLEGITLRRAQNGLDVEICTGEPDKLKAAPYPELLFYSVLNPAPGALTGSSLLKGLPLVSSVLLQILDTLGQNWERLGNVRFAVTYHPGSDPNEQARAGERARVLAREWENAMRQGAGVRDFVAAGDVRIAVIGADAPMPDCQVPVRQLLEQIVAKTGLPPFLLGLTWSSTERMSSVQADLLTSELESYRRVLTPVILRVAQTVLRIWGEDARCSVEWEDITLADEVELARARLLRAQAEKIEEGREVI